jgi:hypothetical protein
MAHVQQTLCAWTFGVRSNSVGNNSFGQLSAVTFRAIDELREILNGLQAADILHQIMPTVPLILFSITGALSCARKCRPLVSLPWFPKLRAGTYYFKPKHSSGFPKFQILTNILLRSTVRWRTLHALALGERSA